MIYKKPIKIQIEQKQFDKLYELWKLGKTSFKPACNYLLHHEELYGYNVRHQYYTTISGNIIKNSHRE